MISISDDGTVLYRAEHKECRKFPMPASGDLKNGVTRNFQVFDPLECPKCGRDMKFVSFIEKHQIGVIEKILKHRRLWQDRCSRGPRQLLMKTIFILSWIMLIASKF